MSKKEIQAEVDRILSLEEKDVKQLLTTLLTEKAENAVALEEKQAELEELKAHVEKLQKNPEEIKRCPKTFKFGGKEYRFKVGVLQIRTRNGLVKAEDVVKDKELRERLVKIGSGSIEVVPAKK